MRAIVNVSPDWGIGFENRLLYTIAEDLRFFRQATVGGVVIYGRKTLETFPDGRPLKHRENIVLSRDPAFCVAGAQVAHDLPALRALLSGIPPEVCWVIGGESIYRLLLPYCSGAAVTKTLLPRPADRFFPNLDAMPHWQSVQESSVLSDGGVPFQFVTYVNQMPEPL